MSREYLKNVNRIEFTVTMACTGRCKHCSEGDHTACREHIDPKTAASSVKKICEVFEIKSLMTFGGEPLLFPETVMAIHSAAKETGIPVRQLITNGFFSKEASKIRSVAQGLSESGVNELLLSVDAFHQETIPLEPVKLFAECVLEKGIPIKLSPAWLVSREDGNPYNVKTRKILSEFDLPVGQGNIIFPCGNALKNLREYFPEDVKEFSPYEEDPKDIRTISFSPNGDVLGGNVYETDILDLMRDY